ncbi:MAG: hypothetical protein RJA98_2829 [Pseudomonadota bacterium]
MTRHSPFSPSQTPDAPPEGATAPPHRLRRAWAAAGLYLALGLVWITSSDHLLSALVRDPEQLMQWSAWKGSAYVLITAALAWVLLRRSEQQSQRHARAEGELRQTIALADAGIAIHDREGRYLDANPRLAEMLGRSAALLRQHHFLDLTHPDDRQQCAQGVARLLDGTLDRLREEKRYLRPDGSEFWALLTVTLVRDPHGAPSHFIAVVQDIANLKAAQAASQALTQQLQALVRCIPDAVTVRDLDGRYRLCNPAAALLLQRDAASVVGRKLEEVHPAGVAATLRHMDHRALDSDEPLRREFASGELQQGDMVLDVRMVRMAPEPGGTPGVLTLARNVSAEHAAMRRLKAAEERQRELLEDAQRSRTALLSVLEDQQLAQGALSASEARLRATVAALPDLLFLFNREHCFVDLWASRPELLIAPREQVLGRSVDELLPPGLAQLARSHIDAVLRDHALQVFSYGVQTPVGERRFEMRMVPTDTGEVLAVARDITEQQEAESQLRLAAAVFDGTLEGVIITGADKRIVSVNKAFTTLLGYAADEVIGQTPRMLSSGRHGAEFYAEMWRALDTVGHWQGELWNRCKDGSLIPELLSINRVCDTDGRVTHFIGVFSDISRLKASEEELEFLAHHDPLTQLPNRLLFQTRLDQALIEAERDNMPLAVLMLDLDRFKDVNDSYGHLTGDALLRHVAERLSLRLRRADTLARLGGDEFALLMQNVQHPEDPARLAGELIAALAEPWQSGDGVELTTGVSVGIAMYPDHGRSAQTLLQGADAALYRAKADGRGMYRYFADEMTAAARERLSLESRLRRALVDGQLRLHYQPQVDIASGRVVGAEALVRWLDPVEGLISPVRFIPVAEATGLIGEVGEWVLREACRQGKQWIDAGLPALTMAVNVSPRQFHLGDLGALTQEVLLDTRFPPEHLELELTESALMEREQEALGVLQRLRGLGVRLAIDDFGTGYSSLAYLKRFPLDVLKIDRSFISDIPHDADDMEISSAIIAMGHSLGVKVLAEGVETVDQLAFLRLKNCDQYQGFLRSKPLPPEEFEALMRDEMSRVARAAFGGLS